MGFLVGKPMHHTSSCQSIETISERCTAKAGDDRDGGSSLFVRLPRTGALQKQTTCKGTICKKTIYEGAIAESRFARNQVPAIVLLQHRTTRLKSNPCSKSRHHLYFALERLKIKP
jgi:hypothetical protein